MAVDDSYTKALLHMDGANGSTTFTDESGKTWTATGGATIATAQSKFGGASGYFDATGQVKITSAVPDFDMGTGDWTVDMWFRPSSHTSQYAALLVGGTSWTTGSGGLYYYQNIKKVGCIWNQFVPLGPPTLVSGTLTDDTWYHVAFVRNGIDFRLYVDGMVVSNRNMSPTDVFSFNNQNSTEIGGGTWDGADGQYKGYIDELRVSKGIARWTANFTPPTAPYAPAPTDSLIYGATLLTELNPASRGKISGAMLLVEVTDAPAPFGIIPTTLASRSTAATLRTKRKTYATLNERSTTLTLEERP